MTDQLRQAAQQAINRLEEAHDMSLDGEQFDSRSAVKEVIEALRSALAAAPQAEPVAYPAPAADLVRDAERYRWLRDTNLDLSIRSDTEHLAPLQVPVIYIGHPAQQWNLGGFASAYVGDKFDQAIDAAIDAAMKGADHE